MSNITTIAPAVCPVCKSSQATVYHQDALVRLLRCRGCGLKYQSPFPDEDALAALYSSEEYYDSQYLPRHFETRRAMFDHRLASLESQGCGPGRVLEIGCGRGQFLEAALARGWKACGQEFAASTTAALAGLVPGADLAHGRFPDECPFPDGTFDLVHLNHVLEHFADPLAALLRIRGLLRPGGFLYCEVPRLSNIQAQLSKLPGLKDFAVTFLIEHLYYFDHASMRLALEHTGFAPVSIRVEGMGDPYRFVRGVHYQSLVTHLLAKMVGGLKLQRPLGGGNLVAVARKSVTP